MSEQRLVDAFFKSFWLLLTLTVVLLISSVLIFLLRKHLFPVKSYGKYSNLIRLVLIVTLFLGAIISGYFFSFRFLDLRAVNNNDFLYVEGEVIEFTVQREGNSPNNPIYSNPIIKSNETGIEIMIRIVDFVELGETYKIIYLEHSKIGVLIDN